MNTIKIPALFKISGMFFAFIYVYFYFNIFQRRSGTYFFFKFLSFLWFGSQIPAKVEGSTCWSQHINKTPYPLPILLHLGARSCNGALCIKIKHPSIEPRKHCEPTQEEKSKLPKDVAVVPPSKSNPRALMHNKWTSLPHIPSSIRVQNILPTPPLYPIPCQAQPSAAAAACAIILQPFLGGHRTCVCVCVCVCAGLCGLGAVLEPCWTAPWTLAGFALSEGRAGVSFWRAFAHGKGGRGVGWLYPLHF